MKDTIDPQSQFPEGPVVLEYQSCEKKFSTKTDAVFRLVSFKVVEGPRETYAERFMPWQMEELLNALGFKKDKAGKYSDVDWDEVPNRIISGQIIHEPDRKDPNKKWPRLKNIVTGKMAEKPMQEDPIEEDVPF
jgi:hypothetical protein